MTQLSRLAAAFLALALLLGACSPDPPPKVYTLVPLPADTTAPAGNLAVSVQQVDIPRYLDRPQIVRYGSTYQLEVDQFARWGEPFGAMVTRVLILDLSRRLPGAQVFQDGDNASVPAQVRLEVTLNGFEADPSNSVILNARWVVRRADGAEVLSSDATEIRIQPGDPSLSGMVSAMSQALAQLSDKIARGLPPL